MAVGERAGHKQALVLELKHVVTQPGQQGDAEASPEPYQHVPPSRFYIHHSSEPVGFEDVEAEQGWQWPKQKYVHP